MESSQKQSWSYTLCGRNGSCCPVVTQTSEQEYTISDDYGGVVRLTAEQVELLQSVVDHVKKNK